MMGLKGCESGHMATGRQAEQCPTGEEASEAGHSSSRSRGPVRAAGQALCQREPQGIPKTAHANDCCSFTTLSHPAKAAPCR